MKTCFKCKKMLSVDLFDNDKSRLDGKFSYCKDCRRKYDGRKKLVRKIIGFYKGQPVCFSGKGVYPTIKSQRAHRYIMEDILGRKLVVGEVVHHIDGNKTNWRPENLCLMQDHRHRVFEGHLRYGYKDVIVCTSCGKPKSYGRSTIEKVLNKKMYQCSNCYYKSGGPGGRYKVLKAGLAIAKNSREFAA